MHLDTFQEFVEFLMANKDSTLNWPTIIIISIISLGVFTVPECITVFIKHEHSFNLKEVSLKVAISVAVNILVVWFVGPHSAIFALIFGILAALYLKNKYFDFVSDATKSAETLAKEQEQQRLKKLFKEEPYYSILEVLLYYGYISPLHKEFIESENIFNTPDEMAEKFLTMSVLTEEQLSEAKAIMNVIRREGKILTRQDALLIVAKLEERRIQNDQDSNS